MYSKQKDRKRIIIIGGGFAGLEAAKRLRSQPADVLLLDRNNYFTFQRVRLQSDVLLYTLFIDVPPKLVPPPGGAD